MFYAFKLSFDYLRVIRKPLVNLCKAIPTPKNFLAFKADGGRTAFSKIGICEFARDFASNIPALVTEIFADKGGDFI